MTDASAIVVGAHGGIGAALVEALKADRRFATVHALARPAVDVTDEATIAAAAAEIAKGPPPVRVIVATGMLHAPGIDPERSLKAIDPQALARLYQVNAIGPALVAKHLLPLLPRDRPTAFAALSARVGSIGDNRLGGWHGYRASKAALNMLIRTLAIEHARTHPLGLCVGLHPGTVDTPLSQPFQRGVRELFPPQVATAHLLRMIDGLGPSDSGGCFAWDGQRVEP